MTTATAAFTLEMEARLADLLTAFKLPTISAELVDRITKAGKKDALPVSSKLPAGGQRSSWPAGGSSAEASDLPPARPSRHSRSSACRGP